MMIRLALALLVLTLLAGPAGAEPISTAIGLTAAISAIGVSTATAAVIGGALVTTAIATGLSLAASALSNKNQPSDGTSPSSSGTTLSVQYGAGLPRSARMGPGATGGHHVYTNVYSVGAFTNMFLECVFVIGDGQHGKLTRLRYNGKDCTLPADTGTGGYVVPEFIQAGNPRVIIRYFRGRYDQAADNELVTHANPPGRWTAQHRGAGVCYLSVTQVYDEELSLTGIPQVLIETEGLLLYDPRKDSTNGGSGAHRWGQVDTYEPSANPAVQEYNFRRGILMNGQRLLGMNITPVNLLLEMYFAGANACDEPMPLAGGGTEPRYRCSIEVNDARSNADVLGALRGAMAGWSLERGGQFGPIPGVPQLPVSALAFTDDDLIVGERATFTKYRSRSELVTAAHGRFADPAQFWADAAFPARENPADDTAIGEKIARDYDLTQVFSSAQAQRIAEIERRRTLQQGQGSATLPAKWIGLQPGDWLIYNSARHGTMTVLVTNVQLDIARMMVAVTYERTSNTVYSWTTAGELFPPEVGDPGIGNFYIDMAQGMTATGVNLPGDGGLVTPGIAFAWTPIMDPSVDQIDFEIRKIGDTSILPFTAEFPSSGSAVCSGHGIAAATLYEYRHKLYTTPLRETPWSGWLTVLSGTQHIVPNALTSIPGDVTLQSFEAGLRDYVGNQLSASQAEIDRIQQLIANEAAEQDAHNFLERRLAKEGDVRLREQVSAQFGFVWRGKWDEFTQYHDGDQVRHNDLMYWTAEDVITTPPPNDPWQLLVSSAMIAENWLTFAGADGAAAQTSNMIEARFKGTFEGVDSDLQDGQTVASALSVIKAFAGADYAVAQTSDQIEARFKGGPINGTPNDLETSVANIITQWKAFAGPDYVSAQTSDSIETRFGGTTLPLSVATLTARWQAYAGADLAVAKSETEVLAAIDGNTASITTNATAIAGINGALAATWQVSADVNGYVAGIKLYNTTTPTTPTSAFVVTADKFIVVQPSAGQGPQATFQIANVNGAAKIALRGDMVADGTITTAALVAGSVTGIKIAGDTITGDKIQGDTITGDKIQANTITADKIQTEQIDTAQIVGGAIVAQNGQNFGTNLGGFNANFNLSIPRTINGAGIAILAMASVQAINGNASNFNLILKVNGAEVDRVLYQSAGSADQRPFKLFGVGIITGNGGTANANISLTSDAPLSTSNGFTSARMDAFSFKR